MNNNEEIFTRLQLIAQKEILSFKEAILYLDVSESFLYKLTAKKEISFSKPNNGKLYFNKKDLNAWMQKNESFSASNLESRVNNYLNKGNHGE